MLSVKNLKFQYDSSTKFQIPDINLAAGDELLILGKSGSGKTTVLNILGGLLKPQSGEVLLGDTLLSSLQGAKLDKFRGKNIGIVFQKPHILAPLTVEENLKLANFFVGEKGEQNIALLKELGILDKRKSKVTTLSEGEAQRVSIARALANQPKLILADEPTASLDDENAAIVIKLLQEQAKKFNAVLIIVTHDQRVKDHVSKHIIMGGL
ncbi:ABC-type antimicrobial peptide transport system, ATPase component [Belliella baltica DSM 15883]|uniref:ABC-type antimicrobial peptide transport system, ATPase component n=1 Tax=Belliella baltica (strain DSM 15883 / CIP 108006 / LMG 21964 / BA134) TaxID=866536 RepID=I3Z0B6_BELBD|nr:ATP-binding cassette domain-containing protein [Belliella baltica]AFL82684.1 ABC-type antimicrobial peptide transport system, ATPase component [Belliella baltica DSM 15883]